MDLSLSIGDSFVIQEDEWSDIKTLYVESVYNENGRKHVQLNYRLFLSPNIEQKLTFIEGIGPNAGILYQDFVYTRPFSAQYNSLICVHKDSIKVHSNPIFDSSCYYKWVGLEEKSQNNSNNFYPNPFHRTATLTFENPESENHTLNLYDLSGRVVLEISNFSGEQVQIEKENLKPGMYFFFLSSGSELKANGKLIIE